MALYPPIVASSMPAFNVKDSVKVYFTIPLYNDVNDIKQVLISVRRQDSNVNVLKATSLSIAKTIKQSDLDKLLNRYYILISNNNLKDSSPFQLNVIYKVQLRFSSILPDSQKAKYGVTEDWSGQAFAKYLNDNIESFSLWSTVCLIKPIVVPLFYLQDFFSFDKTKEQLENTTYYYTSSIADFIGIYKASLSSLILKSWRMRLLSSDFTRKNILNIDDYTLADSGVKTVDVYSYTDESNSIVFEGNLPYLFRYYDNNNQPLPQLDRKYKILLLVQTKNGYSDSKLYSFEYRKIWLPDIIGGELVPVINELEGYIKLSFSTGVEKLSNYVIRRSDAKTNFLKWEDLHNFTWKADNGIYIYYDFTAESGTFYKYLIQRRTTRGRRGTPIYTDPIIGLWLHAFLVLTSGQADISQTKQLKLAYDFQISSYKTNIGESRTDTIGSQYPFIRRNGNMKYKSFAITGTISLSMDNVDLFTTKDIVLNNQTNLYNTYKYGSTSADDIYFETNKYDYTYERNFRQEVEEFLNNSKPKLYKSTQEGNILIKLMEVSFTPKNELGRLIYTFSATAYEIGSIEIANLDFYNIITIGHYNTTLSELSSPIFKHISSYSVNSVSNKQGDNSNTFTPDPTGNLFIGGEDIIGNVSAPAANSIAAVISRQIADNNKIEKETLVLEEGSLNKIDSFKIHYLKIEIESDPYLIKQESDSSLSVDLNSYSMSSSLIKQKLYRAHTGLPVSESADTNYYLGHLFTINGNQIVIAPPNNIYELKLDNIDILSVIPAKDTSMSIDCIYSVNTSVDAESFEKARSLFVKNGQIAGVFEDDDSLYNTLALKYNKDFTYLSYKIEDSIVGINNINIDTRPGAVVKIETTADSESKYMIINETGLLLFDPIETDIYITNFRVLGFYVNEKIIKNRTSLASSKELISNPIDYNRYENYIYYNNQWRKATSAASLFNYLNSMENGYVIDYPIDAIINYQITIEEVGY